LVANDQRSVFRVETDSSKKTLAGRGDVFWALEDFEKGSFLVGRSVLWRGEKNRRGRSQAEKQL
jgi:hypothetical protein